MINNGGCAQTCINTIGSYNCFCVPGYALAADNLGCDGNLQLLLASTHVQRYSACVCMCLCAYVFVCVCVCVCVCLVKKKS